MGIELQSAPQGHQRVSGAHGQANKPEDASQSDDTLGFAALRGLMACQASDGASTLDANATALPPAESDGALVPPDSNALLVLVPTAKVALLAQPSLPVPQSAAVDSLQLFGKGSNRTGHLVAEPDVSQTQLSNQVTTLRALQSGTDQTVGVFNGSSEPDTGPSAGHLGVDMSLPGGETDSASVPELSLQAQTLANSPLPMSVVQVGSQVPQTPLIQADQAPTNMPNLAADHSKAFPLAKSDRVAAEATNRGSVLSMAQTAAQTGSQTFVPMPSEQPSQTVVPRAGGIWTSQQSTAAGPVRQDLGDPAAAASGSPGFDSSTSAISTLLFNPQELGIRQSERPAKHLSSRFGWGGDGAYGQPMATNSPADALFQVAPAAATAASTVVAETVSYWASQGVQNASLQLDGFGDEPVEVRISVSGDMAQVDFKTNQPELRQAIEGAAAQLKDMLSSQGMQLAGLSIGTSGRGGAQDKNPRPSSDIRKVSLVKSEAVEAPRTRGANPSVGQSLDLFV
jgi:flagellar hook-length control protein FliK